MAETDLIAQFQHSARSAVSIQSSLLRSILSHNASCRYLLHHGLCGRTDPLSFKALLPLVEYEDIYPFIQKLTSDNDDDDDDDDDDDGERSSPILCADHIDSFILSSGTSSGKQKIIPSTKELKALITKRFFLTNAILNSEFPLEDAVKSLYFIYAGKVSTTKRGIKVGAASSLYLRDGHLSEHLPNWTSPMGVVLGPNVRESMYCHLLCGLIQANEVRVISSVFAYGITEAFRMLEEVWEELCIDIRSGTLSKSRVTDASVRESVTTTLLLPNPQLSRKVRDECEKGWFGIIKRLWPNVKYIHAISTGSMEPYVPYLKNYAGEIPLVCGDYSSSECSIGVNLNPRSSYDQVSFTLLPYTAYFEFLPMKQNGGDESPVDITGVQIGEEYEVILTTIAGLYRYRLGDVIRITGFYHELPQFSYVMRRNVLFSLNTDKTDEREFLEVNNEASKILDEANMELVDFCGYVDHSSRPGHYAIFWEVSDVASIEDSILVRCCRHIDLSFNDPYQRGRASGTIGPLRLYIVKKGTFQNIMLHAIESGASPAQYKTPRCVKSPDLMRILMDSVVHLYINSGHADVN